MSDTVYDCSICGKNMFRADVSDCPHCTRRHAVMSPLDVYRDAASEYGSQGGDGPAIIMALILCAAIFAVLHFGFGWWN